MKLHDYEDTHSLYFDLSDGVSAGSKELSDDFVVDDDA
jgi:hypothetical protein